MKSTNVQPTTKPAIVGNNVLSAVKKWLTKIKKGLPSFNVYTHNNGAVSITPHLGYQWYKYEGVTSKGCLKRQIHFGWIVWSGQALWRYDA